MKRIPAIVFGAVLAVASVFAVSAHARPHFAGPPAPLCPPDDTSCSVGGQ